MLKIMPAYIIGVSLLLTQVCSNVKIKPQLQPISEGWIFSAKGLWNTSHERAFADVRVFNPLAKSQSLSCKDEGKKRAYDERVHNVEHDTFTPLVFSIAGGMGPIATTFYKWLASLISEKLHQAYNAVNTKCYKVIFIY